MLIDAHVHCWDPTQLSYPWLSGLPVLQRPFLPDALTAPSQRIRPDGMVFVQCECLPDQATAEVAWVSGLADAGAPVVGIVGYAPMHDTEATRAVLAAYATNPRVCGVRRNIQGEAPGFACTPAYVASVRLAAAASLTVDLCITHDQLPDILRLVDQCAEAVFVLDHCGKPPVASRETSPWAAQLRALAAFPNVSCKLSGLATEDGPEWSSSSVAPYLETALQSFGPGRCMFGSDWPVLTLAGEYAQWYDAVADALTAYDAPERAEVWSGTARRTYDIAGLS